MQRICTIYRSSKVEGMYLFVDLKEDLARVPENLLKRFGKPERAMTLVLTPQRQLARADVNTVMESVENQGFYLQMPPRDGDSGSSVACPEYGSALPAVDSPEGA